ncbi:hypothetical protein BDW60DRAFT_199298 [Aspergillus nidulans var. acristatus]
MYVSLFSSRGPARKLLPRRLKTGVSSTPPVLALVVAGGAERSDSCEPRERALTTSPAAATPVPAIASAPYAG